MLRSTTREKIAFLIEGYNLIEDEYQNQKTRFIPERSAITLARLNNYQIFDPIIGVNIARKEVFMELFGSANEFKQKMLVRSFIKLRESIPTIYYEMCDKYNVILDLTKILQICVDNGVINEVPKWANGLTATTFETDMLNEIQTTLGSNQAEFIKILDQEIIFTANKFSFLNLLKFLKENPLINVIYGMIGSHHLAITDHFNSVITQETDELGHGYVHAELKIENRVIEFHLLGSSHENRTDYKRFLECIKNIPNFIIPIEKNLLNACFSFFVPPEQPIKYLHDQQLLHTARKLLDRDYPQDYAEIYPHISQYRINILNVLSDLKERPLSVEDRSSLQQFIDLFDHDSDFEKKHITKNSAF